jgi:hypothetical protein
MSSIHSVAIKAAVTRLRYLNSVAGRHEDIIVTHFDNGTANVVSGDDVIDIGCHWEDGADGDLVLVLDAT